MMIDLSRKIVLVAAALLVLACASSAARGTAGLSAFQEGDEWGYRDPAGKKVIPARYELAQPFSPGGIAAVVDDQGWAIIDARGAVVVRPFVVDNGPDSFSEGLARFVAGGKVGFFDERGRIVVPAAFDFAGPFREGLAAACAGCSSRREGEHSVSEGGTWGYIDRDGRWAIPAKFEGAGEFDGGKARVRYEGAWVSIDKRGRVMEKPLP